MGGNVYWSDNYESEIKKGKLRTCLNAFFLTKNNGIRVQKLSQSDSDFNTITKRTVIQSASSFSFPNLGEDLRRSQLIIRIRGDLPSHFTIRIWDYSPLNKSWIARGIWPRIGSSQSLGFELKQDRLQHANLTDWDSKKRIQIWTWFNFGWRRALTHISTNKALKWAQYTNPGVAHGFGAEFICKNSYGFDNINIV